MTIAFRARYRLTHSLLLALALVPVALCRASGDETAELPKHIRRPVTLVALGERLLVGNQRSETITVVDLASQRVVAEHAVPARIVQMVEHPGPADLLVLDSREHRLLAVSLPDSSLPDSGIEIEPLADVAADPIRMVLDRGQSRVYVSSRWSRRLNVVTFDEAFQTPQRTEFLELPFPPQELLLVDDGRCLLAADAFGGRVALIDTESLAVVRSFALPGHNLRGLAVNRDGNRLYVSQQKLNPLARTEFDDVHWGMLITNAVRVLAMESVLDRAAEPTAGGWLEHLGGVGDAAADPGPVMVDDRGRLIVALSGVDEVAITQASYASRIPVGRRPVALCVADDHRLAVANQLDDSLSLINLESGQSVGTISLGPRPEPAPADRGESLFYDGRLSHDGWMSCHSCHSEGHTAERLVDTLGDGGYGAPKRIPSLLGTGDTGPWAWNASMATLDDQVRQSVRKTMHGTGVTDEQVSDLVAFLKTLPSPPSRVTSDAERVKRGSQIFREHDCVRCHRPPAYTSAAVYDVGLVDEAERKQFNPPSLLGVGQRDRLFHDGRALGLDDVIHKWQHQLAQPLPTEDAHALLEFLRSL